MFSALALSWAIMFSHSSHASLQFFCVAYSSFLSLVTSCRICVAGLVSMLLGSIPKNFARRWMDGVMLLCLCLQSRMCLCNSNIALRCVSSGERSYSNLRFATLDAWDPASSINESYICWYFLILSVVGPCMWKDRASLSTLSLYVFSFTAFTRLSRKVLTLSDCVNVNSHDFVVIGQWTMPWCVVLSFKSIYAYTWSVSAPSCIPRYPIRSTPCSRLGSMKI
jgi:hypothetical protein